MATRPTEKGEETRRRIIQVAAEAFATHGYAGTSLNDVLRASGITKGGFYFYFPSKESLALAVVEAKRDEKTEWVAAAQRDNPRAIDQLAAIVREVVDRACNDPSWRATAKLCDELCQEPALAAKLGSHHEFWVDLSESLIGRAQAEGDVPTEIDARTAAEHLVALIVGIDALVAGPWRGDGDRVEALIDFYLQGLGARR